MIKRTHRNSSRRAFTLLEVMLVIVILGALAATVAVVLRGAQDKANNNITKLLINKVAAAIERYNLDMHHYPTDSDGGLRALIEQPSDADQAKKWGGPYVEAKDLKDIWEHDLVYACPGQYNTNGFDLSSLGKDGSQSDDDITNWEKAP